MVLSMFAMVSCKPSLPRAPLDATDDPAFVAEPVALLPGLPEEEPGPFLLLAGDLVSVRIHSVEKHELMLSVDATGRIYLPSVGAVPVGGLELPVAEARVERAFRRQDRFAEVVLALAETGGHRAAVVGAVEHPGEFALRPTTRVAELVAMSGGARVTPEDAELTDLADMDGARVIRAGQTLPVSVRRALLGDPRHNVAVRAGDLLYVPPARGTRISVVGEVQKPRVVPHRIGLRLSEAVAMAGGLSTRADDADVRIIRGPLSEPRVYRTSVADLAAGRGRDVVLVPGDVVFVTESWFASVTDVLHRLTPFLAATALTVAISK